MICKIKALIWKDLAYRLKVTTFIPWMVLFFFGLLANLEALTLFSCCEEPPPVSPFGPRFFKQFNECASSPFDDSESKILAYEPGSPFLSKLMEDVACLVGFNKTNVIEGFNKNFDFGVKFNGVEVNQTNPPESLDYVLYPTKNDNFSHLSLNLGSYNDLKNFPIYKMKIAIDRAFLQRKENSAKNPKRRLTSPPDDDEVGYGDRPPVPWDGPPEPWDDRPAKNWEPPPKRCNKGTYRILYKVLLPFIMFILESDRFLSCIVKEKNSGVQEFLKVMGMRIWLTRLSAFFVSIMTHLLAIFIVLIFLYVPFAIGSVVYFTVNAGTMFFYFFIFTFYISAFIYMGSFFFKSGPLASFINFILWFSSVIFFAFLEVGAPVSKTTVTGIAFIPHFWCLQGFTLLSKFERLGKSVVLYDHQSYRKGYIPVLDFFLIGIFGTVMYILIGAYLENILPGKYGRSLPLYYIFIKSFWRRKEVEKNMEVGDSEEIKPDREMFEEKPRHLKVGITIQNLTKTYSLWKKTSSKKALDDVTFDVYEGEILGLLGHNGAGKTTIISILCGMISSTSGKVIINGVDIQYRNSPNAIGYCPQFDILLNGLSVYQNLMFFGLAKNLRRSVAAEEAIGLLQNFGLLKSKNVRASNLSGGQRRKLSLAIALIGSSPVLILDEPTTGIDVPTRREIWELLLKLRGKKTIILSTHFMEEADALCDRIVVIADGQVRSHGTPMFLKSKLGSGYTLSVVVPNRDKIDGITDLVLKKIKGSAFKRQNLLTITYQLPEKEFSAFPSMFEALESKKKNGEIVSYSATASTMDEVFLNLDEALKKDNAAKKGMVQQEPPLEEEQPRKPNLKGILLLLNQLVALFIKKWIFLQRDFIFFISLAVITLALDAIFDHVVSQASIKTSTSLEEADGSCSYLGGNSTERMKSKINSILYYESLYNNRTLKATVDYKYLKNNGFRKAQRSVRRRRYNLAESPILYPFRFSNFFLVFFLFGIVKEYDSHLKTFQLMLVPPIIYWLPHIIFDYILLVAHSTLSFIILAYSNEDTKKFMISNHAHIAFGMLFYLFCMLLFTYIMAKTCKRIVVALVYILTYFLLGIMFLIPFSKTVWIRYLFSTTLSIDYLLLIDPDEDPCREKTYLADSMYDDYDGYDMHAERKEFNRKFCNYTKSLPAAMISYVLLLVLILIFLDSGVLTYLFHKIMSILCCIDFHTYKHPEDSTVESEIEVIKDLKARKQLSSKVIVIDGVRRWYCSCRNRQNKCTTVAVDGVSFTVAEGECFALLGVNGAGKTTVFKMLTGMIEPTKGNAYVKSCSVLNFCCRFRVISKMGYCSQFANYFPNFKGREMIELFGRLRGMRGSQLRKEVDKLVQISNLQEYERNRCKSYSGGTLRKLAVLMAMIGKPLIILLDEPTTGVDPAARRSIWDLVTKYRDEGHSVLLTSHSMEECEALSSRVAIMIKGRLQCVGEPTTLKSLFGQMYFVLLKLSINATDEDRSKLKKAITDTFGDKCQLVDENLSIIHYQIPMESANWEKLFSGLNSMKSKHSFLEHFSASSTTLEQVFLHFTERYRR